MHSSPGLVQHQPGMGQGMTFALGAASEEDRAHTIGLAYAKGRHIAWDIFHCVVDRQPCGETTARAVDIE